MATAQFPAVRHALPGASTTESNTAERVVLMCASALFTGLTPIECMEIASFARVRKFERDELLFMQGQPVRNLVVLQSGRVKLTQLGPNGNEVILWMNGSGDTVGVPTDATASSHTCSARAMEPCRALTWEFSTLQHLLVRYPKIRNNINQILSSRLNELEERFREIATEKVSKRLALALLRLMKQLGKQSPGGAEVLLSREELAQMTGTTLFTISRILSRWSREGFVMPRREAVLVRDPQRLVEVGAEDI